MAPHKRATSRDIIFKYFDLVDSNTRSAEDLRLDMGYRSEEAIHRSTRTPTSASHGLLRRQRSVVRRCTADFENVNIVCGEVAHTNFRENIEGRRRLQGASNPALADGEGRPEAAHSAPGRSLHTFPLPHTAPVRTSHVSINNVNRSMKFSLG
ncbi:hypothetical protein AC579_7264 [Pseudocercospora musae]|uniref:Uncharacterized protein n=1 Tax=Pseudocercospora musae TaxID=113226 RepID=A0A139I3P1_9PEZI|nr:hypothetical protein AC579_7264 [Pseudocercospora musae]